MVLRVETKACTSYEVFTLPCRRDVRRRRAIDRTRSDDARVSALSARVAAASQGGTACGGRPPPRHDVIRDASAIVDGHEHERSDGADEPPASPGLEPVTPHIGEARASSSESSVAEPSGDSPVLRILTGLETSHPPFPRARSVRP